MRRVINKIKSRDLHFIYYAAIASYILMLLTIFIFPVEFSSYKITDEFSQFWYYVTETGSGIAAAISIIFLIFYLKLYYRRKAKSGKGITSFVMFTIISLLMISTLSHYIWKDLFQVPRPSLVIFQEKGLITKLGEEYSELSVSERSRLIAEAISFSNVSLSDINPSILKSWIKESGYSFPSGHSQTAFFLGILFSFIIYRTMKGRWKYLSFIPLAWAILVGVSRVVIGVHYSVDIAAGALLGMVMALVIITSSRLTGIFDLEELK